MAMEEDTATSQNEKEQPEKGKSFEQASQRVNELLEQMGRPDIPLELALKLYEEADELILFCQQQLTQAEQKIEQLVQKRNLEPFAAEAS